MRILGKLMILWLLLAWGADTVAAQTTERMEHPERNAVLSGSMTGYDGSIAGDAGHPPGAAAAAAPFEGAGTADEPYRLTSAADLCTLADAVNAGKGKYAQAAYRLDADVDLSGVEWRPLGRTPDTAFTGSFDGNSKTIGGLKLSAAPTGDETLGLFGCLSGELRNLTLSGELTISVDFAADDKTDIYIYVGGLVGRLLSGSVRNCVNHCSILVTEGENASGAITIYAGGIAANARGGVIADCENAGEVSLLRRVSGEYGYAGGICGGASDTTLRGCANLGAVRLEVSRSAFGHAGGIVGGIIGTFQSSGTETGARISGCVNRAAVSATRAAHSPILSISSALDVGGIAGNAYLPLPLENCSNFGAISIVASTVWEDLDDNLGGIVGGALYGSLVSCANHGEIVYTGGVAPANETVSIGGIAGGTSGESLANCQNTGTVRVAALNNSSAAYPQYHVGGIVGSSVYGNVILCENQGELSLALRRINQLRLSFGGIAGYAAGGELLLCQNAAPLTGEIIGVAQSSIPKLYLGGIAGEVGDIYPMYDLDNDQLITTYHPCRLEKCQNTGSATLQNKASNTDAGIVVGGIAGLLRYGSIAAQCENAAAVYGYATAKATDGYSQYSAFANCGGLVGAVYENCTLQNCVNRGEISGSSVTSPHVGLSKACVGGLASVNGGIVDGCLNLGGAVYSNETWQTIVGGVVGEERGSLTNCYYLLPAGTEAADYPAVGIAASEAGAAATAVSADELHDRQVFSGLDFGESFEMGATPALRAMRELTDASLFPAVLTYLSYSDEQLEAIIFNRSAAPLPGHLIVAAYDRTGKLADLVADEFVLPAQDFSSCPLPLSNETRRRFQTFLGDKTSDVYGKVSVFFLAEASLRPLAAPYQPERSLTTIIPAPFRSPYQPERSPTN